MRVDSHQHFWRFNPKRDAWITNDMQVIQRDFLPEHLLPILSESNIDACVAVQADQSDTETEFLLDLAASNPFICGVVGWVDLRDPALEEKLSAYTKKEKLKGFRHIVQGEPAGFLTDKRFIKGVRALGRMGYTYDLLIYYYQLAESLEFVKLLHDTKVVVDHIAKPSIRTGDRSDWQLHMAALSSFPNVYCKVSGMVTEANWSSWKKEDIYPFLDEVLETFGPSRMMYGSDWPVCLVAAEYQEQLNLVEQYIASLSSTEQEKIMGGTAISFYNL